MNCIITSNKQMYYVLIQKSGKWNAMHVRVAWEIYHHQQKGDATKPGAVKTDLLRPPTHLFSPSVHHTRPHDLTFPSSLPTHRAPAFDQAHPGSLFSAPPSHIGKMTNNSSKKETHDFLLFL